MDPQNDESLPQILWKQSQWYSVVVVVGNVAEAIRTRHCDLWPLTIRPLSGAAASFYYPDNPPLALLQLHIAFHEAYFSPFSDVCKLKRFLIFDEDNGMNVQQEESESETLAVLVIGEDFERVGRCSSSNTEQLKEENDGGHGCGRHWSCSALRRASPPPISFCVFAAAFLS